MFHIEKGDITKYDVDAIVNAANPSLLGGGGVDGAIHEAAGPELLEACRSIGGCPTGEARITMGYDLDALYVIHTVGPIYKDGKQGEKELLEKAYASSINLAKTHDVKTLAFPLISGGVYGYPLDECLDIAIESLDKEEHYFDEVYLVLFSDELLERALEEAKKLGVKQWKSC